MANQEYKNAPVSEVILGVTFKQKIIGVEALFELRQFFKDEFPIIELNNPLANVYLRDFKIVNEVDSNNVGPFRLRLRSKNSNWLIQIQLNKFYLNWIRKDSDKVGNYPGYNFIKDKFTNLLSDYLEESNTSKRKIDYYELSYHDRLEWQKYIDTLNDVNKIVTLSSPKLNSEEDFNNINTRYTNHVPSLNGYGILNLNTSTSIENKQILKFEKILRGSEEFKNLDDWFENAHQKQLSAFKNTFQTEILESWK